MNSALTTSSPVSSSSLSSSSSSPSLLHFKKPVFTKPSNLRPYYSPTTPTLKIKASSSHDNDTNQNPLIRKLKTAASAVILTAAASGMMGKFSNFPARAETQVTTTTEEIPVMEEKPKPEFSSPATPLSQFLETNEEAVVALKSLLQQNLENGEDQEALKVLNQLALAQPSVFEWKFLKARLLNEMGNKEEARNIFEDILKDNPLSFEVLFENALLMDQCGEGEAVIKRLEEALRIAEEENKVKDVRNVKLIMAQIMFLQKNVDDALKSYEELEKEDPSDFRPYFCKGMIYSLMDKNDEAKVEFAKYKELSSKKFEVDGYLRTPLSRMKIFGTNEEN